MPLLLTNSFWSLSQGSLSQTLCHQFSNSVPSKFLILSQTISSFPGITGSQKCVLLALSLQTEYNPMNCLSSRPLCRGLSLMMIRATLWDSGTIVIHFQLELSCCEDPFGNQTWGFFFPKTTGHWKYPRRPLSMNLRGSATILDVEGVCLLHLLLPCRPAQTLSLIHNFYVISIRWSVAVAAASHMRAVWHRQRSSWRYTQPTRSPDGHLLVCC